MIDRTLPALGNYIDVNEYEAAQAFSFCYLASYSHAAVPARVNTSLSRAWNYDHLYTVERVADSTPSYAVAIWNNNDVQRIIVAVEGMTSRSQVWSRHNGFQMVPATGLEGHVQNGYQTYADAIKAQLLANTAFSAAWNRNGTVLIFTGFSLGAAIAEVLAVKFQKDNPSELVKLYKFASPMVGTSRWANSRYMVPNRMNYYAGWDPVHQIPYGLLRNPVGPGLLAYGTVHFAAGNRPIERRTQQWDMITAPPQTSRPFWIEETYAGYIQALALTRMAIDQENWWYWHDKNIYRTMFCGLVSGAESAMHYRFRYLEYDDDNQWGQVYRRNEDFDPAFKVMADPAPAPVVVPHQRDTDVAIIVGGSEGGGADDPQENQGRVLQTPRQFNNPAWRPRRMSRSPLSQR